MSNDKKMSAEEFMNIFNEIELPTKTLITKNEIKSSDFAKLVKPDLSSRACGWIDFSDIVLHHIEDYTVPQYGDKGNDLCSEYTVEECLRQAKKYIERYGKNARDGQQELDFLKAAHFIQMGYEKYMSQQENK